MTLTGPEGAQSLSSGRIVVVRRPQSAFTVSVAGFLYQNANSFVLMLWIC